MLLAGDIGGTKTVLALFQDAKTPRVAVVEAIFPSARYGSLEAIVREFLGSESASNASVTRAGFGVAGPVVDGRARITNLPWTVDADGLKTEFGLESVRLANDLAAIATAVPHLGADDLVTLNTGNREPGGAIAVIAPGTGLGEAYLTWTGDGYLAHGSEGGHSSFAARTAEEMDLLSYLEERLEHVSYERVCSGTGIPNIFHWLADTGRYPVEPWLAEECAQVTDITPVIMNAGLEDRSPLCRAVLDQFIAILAAETGNLALKVLATGGVYIGGGIPPRILSVLTAERFMPLFRAKGRMAGLLDRMPLHVIKNPKVALLGAAYVGMQ